MLGKIWAQCATQYLEFLKGQKLLSDSDIARLVYLPKTIQTKRPVAGYREVNGYRRCELDLQATSGDGTPFSVFVRQNLTFTENFSVGLRYFTGDGRLGSLTLVRYNGPHGEYSRHPNGHFAMPHIHRITEDEIASGSSEPQEQKREVTQRYRTFDQALLTFFSDIAAANFEEHFPNLSQLRLLNGHC